MFIREHSVKRGDKEYKYLKILESYREGGQIKQRTVLNLGNVESWTEERLKTLIRLISTLTGNQTETSLDGIRVLSSLTYGTGLALDGIWEKIGISEMIDSALSKRRPEFDVAAVIEAMVTNRLVEPTSKLGVSRWAERNYCEGLPVGKPVPAERLYRSLDYLTEIKESLEENIYLRVSNLFTLDVIVICFLIVL